MASYSIYQDVITQLPSLNGYSHIARFFETAPHIPRDAIVDDIQVALDTLTSKIPFLGHQVVLRDGGPGASSRITSEPWPTTAPPNRVVRADKDAELPSLRAFLSTAGGLDATKDVIPFPCLPERHGLDLVPVFAVRIVFIRGGAIVILSGHHNMLDGLGTLQLFDYLATLMSGDAISEEAIAAANTDKTRVLPLLQYGEPIKDCSYLWRPDPWPLPPPPKTEWRVFYTSREAVAQLRAEADSSSFDDALTAFCWQRITAVRFASGRVRASQCSKFGRAVSGRGVLGLDSTYLGHMMIHAITRLPIGEVVRVPLASLARQLRQDLDEARTEWNVRSYATFLAGVADKTKLLYGGITNPRTDLGGTSLLPFAFRRPVTMGSKLGMARMFRKPQGVPIPACMYFLPADNDTGDVQILLCLAPEELDALVDDEQWKRHVRAMGGQVDVPKL